MSATIVLISPKHEVNVANTKRAAACLGAESVVTVGKRFTPATGEKGNRRPRPFRMKVYDHVTMLDVESLPSIDWESAVIVEKLDWAPALYSLQHPKNPVYIFGPEDGSVPKWIQEKAKHRAQIPSGECMNLATCVAVVLYDRNSKEQK